MKKIRTPQDIINLPEDEKDLVFAFDTARERLKHRMLTAFGGPFMLTSGVFIYSNLIPGMPDWLQGPYLAMSYMALLFAAGGIAFFSGGIHRLYVAILSTREQLELKGLDVSDLKSRTVWESLGK